MREPIQGGGKLHEGEKCEGQFVVAGSQAAESFESCEVAFDSEAQAVAALEGHELAPAAQPSNSNLCLLPVQLRPGGIPRTPHLDITNLDYCWKLLCGLCGEN